MQITNLKLSKHDQNRANIYVDGIYSFSLTLDQILDYKIKIGGAIDESNIIKYKQASFDSKIFGTALNYCLIRPRFKSEVRSYLLRKKCDKETIESTIIKLQNKNVISDENAARYWVDNRRLKKGMSIRRLTLELKAKGVDDELIKDVINNSSRYDEEEIYKIITKKYSKYNYDKLVRYLISQGFNYDTVTKSIADYETESKDSS